MRVLSILYDDCLNGVTTFNYTLLCELKKRGHYCSVIFQNEEDEAKYKFEDVGITIGGKGWYDIVIINNRMGEAIASVHFKANRYLYFVHSIMNPNSLPPESDLNLELFVFSEVSEGFIKKRYTAPTLIRNGIDMERFKPVQMPKASPSLIQVLDLRNNELYAGKVENAAKFNQMWVGKLTAPRFDIPLIISRADVCIGYGRHAIEAMAMGKPTIVYGVNGGDGLVTPKNMEELSRTNFSGWSLRTMPPPGELTEFYVLQELDKVQSNYTEAVTAYIRENYSITKSVDLILNN